MRILAHRGYWKKPEEKNSKTAFLRALEFGFGIETDLRDSGGQVVVSHDMPRGGEMTLEQFCELCRHADGDERSRTIRRDSFRNGLFNSSGTNEH